MSERLGGGRETPLWIRAEDLDTVSPIGSVRSKESIVQYVYTVGVMTSAAFLGNQFGGFDGVPFWISTFVVALGWVGYYRLVVVPRFEQFDDGETETVARDE